jgi:hypothetical protein
MTAFDLYSLVNFCANCYCCCYCFNHPAVPTTHQTSSLPAAAAAAAAVAAVLLAGVSKCTVVTHAAP